MNPWLSLLLASLMEIGWIFSLKYLRFSAIKSLKLPLLLQGLTYWKPLAPLAGYVCFGLANILLFNHALKYIPAPLAFAVWMGLALAGTTIAEALVSGGRPTFLQVLFTLLIFTGIVGLKITGDRSSP